ncbi:MAG: WS/DGAT/MGAT family O-acyltransferase [Tepidiformaceae bacterium]
MPPTSLKRRMTSADASFLYFEKPTAPLHIGSTCVLSGELSKEALVSHMESRMHRIPRYREIAAFDPLGIAHPRWEQDPDFDVKRHIDEVTMPPGSSYEDLLQAIANEHAKMLPRDRPLWRMILFQGIAGGKTGVTSLVHHCMVDGVSGIELLAAVTDLAEDTEPDQPQPFEPGPAATTMERISSAWRDAAEVSMTATADAVRWALDPQQQASDVKTLISSLTSAAPSLLRPAPSMPFNRPVGGKRNYAVVAMPFGEMRGIRGILGGTINDVVLSTLSGGLGSFLREHGVPTDGVELRAMVPVNVRSESDKTALGNQVSMLIAPLPIGITDAAQRHRAVIAGMDRLKAANQAGGFALLGRLTESLPAGMQALAGLFAPTSQSLFNLVCTNVPGPQIPLYMAGQKVEELWPLVPLSSGLGLNVCLTSYNAVLYWGICADPTLVPEVASVAVAVGTAFEELKAVALEQGAAATR